MDLESLIAGLAIPEAYPHPVDGVEIRQTHISVVALAGDYVYKVKKPVDLGFLDFTTVEKRLHFCREEVRLNRRLAPHVYLGVVPLVERDGRIEIGGEGRPFEYAVKMRRLPEDATLRARLEKDEVERETLGALGRRIASFHQTAEAGPRIAEYGRWTVVAANARENLAQSRAHVGTSLTAPILGRLERALEQRLRTLRAIIESRAAAQMPRDTHGDLHLDHVYFFPDAPPPRDFVIIDCVEFNERFRYADPVADVAFLVMDLLHHGRWDLAEPFLDEYFRATGDVEGGRLLAFYVAYRAAVRAKVGGMLAGEQEVPEAQRAEAVRRARAHWLLALSELEGPATRPGLVLVGGLPGTGKTTLAAELAQEAGFTVVSTDRTRKELAGLDPDAPAASAFGTGLYTPEWNDRTYAACLDRARALLLEGGRVVVDGSFREAERRRAFRDAAVACGVRSIFLVCSAEPEVVRTRLSARRGGPSDADWSIHEAAARVWECGSYHDPRWERIVPTAGTRADALAAALDHLRAVGLAPMERT
jgi:aminoglycoside phosphotransferase family enzyme/predicted kinase